MSGPERGLTPAGAVLLGAIHGPAELLPISSSAHLTLVPWLLGWPYARLEGELRKAFEVALHAGTAAALALRWRRELELELEPRLVAGALAPAVVAGAALERPIERRLGAPAPIAAALAAGAAAMLAADRRPQRRARRSARGRDALALGLAQACALAPGISRSGATLAAARLRGFTRAAAAALSREVGLPVVAGAAALKAARLARTGLARPLRAPFALGTATAFASTWLAAGTGAGRGPLAPYAAYRLALAAAVVARLRENPRA